MQQAIRLITKKSILRLFMPIRMLLFPEKSQPSLSHLENCFFIEPYSSECDNI